MAKENKSITLPEGRLIHGHLFTKQQYNDKATPKYSAEMAFEEGVLEDAGIWAILEERQGWFGLRGHGSHQRLDHLQR